MTYAICCQIKWSWTKMSIWIHQELPLGAYRFGHLLRTVALNSFREGGIWMQFQLETDLFANDCDHDSVMSESFFHLSNPCQLKPPSLLPWRKNQKSVPKMSEKVVLWSITDVYYPNVSFFFFLELFQKKDTCLVCILQVHFPERNFTEAWHLGLLVYNKNHCAGCSVFKITPPVLTMPSLSHWCQVKAIP